MLQHSALESKLQRTKYEKLSAEYATRIAEMDKKISNKELRKMAKRIRIAPLLTLISLLGEILADKTKAKIPGALQKRTEEIWKGYNSPSQIINGANEVLGRPISRGVRAHIFDTQRESVVELNDLFCVAESCISSPKTKSPQRLGNEKVNYLFQDAIAGGCIHFSLEDRRKTAYNRIYLAVDTKKQVIGFYDTIEPGNMAINNMYRYREDSKENLLLGSFAASIIIAQRLSLPRIALGDYELEEMGEVLGYTKKRIFRKGYRNNEQKLGYVGADKKNNYNDEKDNLHLAGPHLWRMNQTKEFSVLEPRHFLPEAVERVEELTERVEERFKQYPKSARQLQKGYELFSLARMEMFNSK